MLDCIYFAVCEAYIELFTSHIGYGGLVYILVLCQKKHTKFHIYQFRSSKNRPLKWLRNNSLKNIGFQLNIYWKKLFAPECFVRFIIGGCFCSEYCILQGNLKSDNLQRICLLRQRKLKIRILLTQTNNVYHCLCAFTVGHYLF